ncbi:AAA family ATPase [Methylobacterium haplocladii]|nr:AAA family ATPase [Methylobacterium haplocladii]GJD82296.1 ATP-dependent zinc metalloprotease FtsH [Methylobacterium haplocladii]
MFDSPISKTIDVPAGEAPAAASTDQLARAFLKALAQKERERWKHGAKEASNASFVDDDDPVEKIIAQDEPDRQAQHVPVPPGRALTAVLVARAIEADSDVLRRLRRENPVVVIATHMPELIDATRYVVEKCALPTDTFVKDLNGSKYHDLRRSEVGLVVRDGSGREHNPDTGNAAIGAALHAGAALIGIAPDPKRQLPRDLLRSAEHRLVLPPIDHGAIALMVEAVTGGVPTRRLDDALLRTLDIGDLPVALRNVRSADDGIDAIARVLSQKADYLESGPSLDELHGYGAARDWGLALAQDLNDYRAGRIDWSDIDNRGLLLSGPPGVGKTSFAKALAKSARVPLVATSVAEWNSANYMSGTLQAIREAFSRARAQAPCLLFIDELDGISDRTQIRGEYVQYWTQIVNLFLELLAGVEERPGVVVVAATNHPDRIDAAVKRAGRLDREIAIEKPDVATLDRIFRHHLGAETLPDISLAPVALAARGRTGADVESFVRRARGRARRGGRELLLADLMAEVRDDAPQLSSDDRRRIAIHEAGHAVACRALGFHDAIVDVSLSDAGGLLVMTQQITGCSTLPQLEAMLTVILSGRAAERICLGEASIGAGGRANSDLERATTIARDIEARYGLGALGPVLVDVSATDLLIPNGLLEQVAKRLRAAEERARVLLEDHRKQVEAIAAALEAEGYLAGAEIERLLATAASPSTPNSEGRR